MADRQATVWYRLPSNFWVGYNPDDPGFYTVRDGDHWVVHEVSWAGTPEFHQQVLQGNHVQYWDPYISGVNVGLIEVTRG